MARIHEMKQERARLTAAIREVIDKAEGRELTAEENTGLRNLESEFDTLVARLDTEERQLERERTIGEVAEREARPEAKERLQLFGAALSGEPHLMANYRASLTLGDDAQAGSLTAPMEFRHQLIKELDDLVFMRRISTMLPTLGAAQSLGYPYRMTEATDAEWVGEVAPAPEENTLKYGRREFKPNRMAKLIKLSDTLMSHATLAPRVIKDEMSYRIAVTQENAYMTGDGVDKPLGVFTASNSGIPATRDISDGNTATAVTYDGLINAKYSLKQQYLTGAQWIMHRELVRDLVKIKDGEGQYIWQPSVANSAPDRLLGHAVNMSEFAPNTFAAGQYAAIFGNFKYYWIVDTDTLTVKVLKELYAPNNQIGYLYNYFGDGAPVLAEAFSRVQLATA